ncbi:hypothetical protein BAR153v2_010420 [Bartonella sp. AR 15-3]|nr:hypothetical protein BAR153v2_010420 [Bartonella sp. AR 15-3]CBI78875.1 hypothetical protein BAR15_110071 [Bartonella sp. AR 15-3]
MIRTADLLGMEHFQAEMFQDLERGHFIALRPALSRRSLAIIVGPVETSARSSGPKIMPLSTERTDAKNLFLLLYLKKTNAISLFTRVCKRTRNS